jgi:hypothetical protein
MCNANQILVRRWNCEGLDTLGTGETWRLGKCIKGLGGNI